MHNGQPKFLAMSPNFLSAIARARDAANETGRWQEVVELFNVTTGATRYGTPAQMMEAVDEMKSEAWSPKTVAMIFPEFTNDERKMLKEVVAEIDSGNETVGL